MSLQRNSKVGNPQSYKRLLANVPNIAPEGDIIFIILVRREICLPHQWETLFVFSKAFAILTTLKRQCRAEPGLRCAEMPWRTVFQQLPHLFGITELVSPQTVILAGSADTGLYIFNHYCMATTRVSLG